MAQTRIISVILYYHLAFFAISMAMLGMTAGSLLIYFRTDWFPRERLFEDSSGSAPIRHLGCPLDPILDHHDRAVRDRQYVADDLSGLAQLILILLPPYVLAGMAISMALTRSPYPVGVVYGIDLLGAASGC